ncbi:hypothetical protein P691DRAFT_685291 [Macrolepiota fuliginosa MF-IS2]|uniref:Uncharacterized protein n=1 Tax=Macrolepiota fuliginosa MF-IS2 TaxID=1400762 RepID=A0A9P5WXS5_9AGAR|nr:hypothetical protein P691DRAFT_685291 [Macrolepiota fuliginosa MF-IS2]
MHTIRGVKHAHYHRYDEVSAEWYWTDFFKYTKLTDEVLTLGHWWVDVGIEVSSDTQACLQWMTSSHCDVAREALRIPEEDAQRITNIKSSKYSRDLVSHLTAISGFRIVPGVRAEGVYEAAYLQAYTTDKATVYNTDGRHHAKFLTTKEAMGQAQPTKTIDGIHSIYTEAVDVNHSKARLEVRVPFDFATQALLNFDPEVLQGSLCAFSQEEWWNFRIMRLMGISQTLCLQAGAPSDRRFHNEALTLTAACVWLVNGLHARPDDGPASRKLMDAVLPITEAADADTSIIAYNVSSRPPGLHGNVDEAPARTRKVPYNPYGCVFFRRLIVADGPRLRFGGPVIFGPAFEFWFNGLDATQLQARYQTSGIIDKNVIAHTRSTANRAKLVANVDLTDQPQLPLFNFTAQGLSLPPPIPDDASDVEDRLSPAHEQEDEPLNIDTFASKIWGQFVSDITMKSPVPNGKTKPSYLKLTDIERRSSSEIPYKTARLSDIFRCVYWRKADEKDWELSFKWLFPPHGYKTSTSVQNYLQSPYFRMWLDFLEKNNDDPGSIEAVRKGFFKRIRTWTWMPNAQGDRMWPTGGKKPSSKRFVRWPADDTRPPAPHILFKLGEEPVFEESEGEEQGQGNQERDESGDE